MSEATIQRCTATQCVDGLQRAHESVKPTRPGYCSWCWNEIPAVDTSAVVIKRLLLARNSLINGTDGDDLEFAIGDIEAVIEYLGGSLPIYRVRAVMLHDIKDPEYTYADSIFDSVNKALEYIDDDSDEFVDACSIDTKSDSTLQGYRFDDLEIVQVATTEFPIEILEVIK